MHTATIELTGEGLLIMLNAMKYYNKSIPPTGYYKPKITDLISHIEYLLAEYDRAI